MTNDAATTNHEEIQLRNEGPAHDVEAQEHGPPNAQNEAKIGLAFSGGGIRSAALCSGVLRRLLHRGMEADYISCVSGGNFTAASYVDWKYHNDNADNPEWHKEYFEQMRRSAGYICNWQVGWKGILDSFFLAFLLLFVNIVIPFAVWGSFSIPVAYVVDLLFGDIMRVGFNCTRVNRNSEKVTTCGGEFYKGHLDINQPIVLFTLLIIGYVVLFIVKRLVPTAQRFKVLFLELVSGLVLAFVFLPWLIQQYFDAAPWYLNIIIIVLSIFFWLGFPLLRKKASLALVFYAYAFVTRWRVYKGIAPPEYTERNFFHLLLLTGIVIWASPFLGMVSNTAIFTFFKWRLQKAFFHRESSGPCGCRGISCRDFFPVTSVPCPCNVHDTQTPHDPPAALTMADIRNVKPKYISNVTVDYWKKSREKHPYSLLSISPTEVERVDRQPDERNVFENKLGPEDIKVADAMTISASVMSPSEANDDTFRDLQILLGLAIRKHTRSDHTRRDGTRRLVSKIVPVLLQSIVAFPLVFLPVIQSIGKNSRQAELCTMVVFGIYMFLFTAIACFPEKPECGDGIYRLVRWCHVHMYHVRFLRELLRVTKCGTDPPALLALSDAGRLEKYGLIPLLKLKLPKIVIVDGSYIRDDKYYAKYLLKSLKLAREELGCEFVGYGGRDVLGEIKKKYIEPYPEKKRQRSYRFLVRYFQAGCESPVSSGELLIIAPRHPNDGVDFPADADSTWAQFTHDTGQHLDQENWGSGVVLEADEVDRLTFCCCECCHSSVSCIQTVSRALCSGFSSHSTANQFFTPSQFTAYHREGYRACVEAGVEELLKAQPPTS